MKKINIIIPTYNESKNILPLIKEIKRYLPDANICVVDDSKKNIIGNILKKNNFHKVIYFHRKNKKGRGSAVIYGFKKLFNKNIDQIFIEMDADFSHRPSELKKNIKLFKKNKSDLLIASRYLKKSKILNWSMSRKILSKLSNILAKTILKHTEKNYKERPIDIFIMKDFVSASLTISNELISLGYYSFNVEPNMKLTIHENWQNFDHYLTSLKTKFRVKAKKALKLSHNLLVKEITVENFDEQVKEMTELYKRVASKADFNLGAFNLATYKSLKEKLGDVYLLKSYWLDHKMVGFMSGMLNENKLDAHFVGIDYELNRSYAIYQRMLYDYIGIAITKKITTLNFGRTASEIKSSVGATPEHLTVYIRHKKSITNKFLKLFLLKIQPTEFHQKFPFKIESKNS